MNRFDKIVFRVASSVPSSSGFTGRGRLVEYKDRGDSWVLNQMDKKKVDPGIEMKKDTGDIKFKTKGGKYK